MQLGHKDLTRLAAVAASTLGLVACESSTVVDKLPELPVGTASISLDAGAYTQYRYVDGEMVGNPTDAEQAELNHAMAVRFIEADGRSTLHFLFSNRSLDGVRLRDPFGGSGFVTWRRQGLDSKYLYLERKPGAEEYGGMSSPGGMYAAGSALEFTEGADGVLKGTVEFTREPGTNMEGETIEPSLVASGSFEVPIAEVRPVSAVACTEGLDGDMEDDLLSALEVIAAADLDRIKDIVTPGAYDQLQTFRAEEGDEAVKNMLSFIAVPPDQFKTLCESGDAKIYRAGHMIKIEYQTAAEDGSTESGAFHAEWQEGRWLLST